MILMSVGIGLTLSYFFISFVSFFDKIVGLLWGTLSFILAWISIIALLMILINISGHIILILIGIPLCAVLVRNERESKLDHYLMKPWEKLITDLDALQQIYVLQQVVETSSEKRCD